MNNKKIIINIGREVGSGGHIIGQKLAERFNIPLHDREILNLAAKESGFRRSYLKRMMKIKASLNPSQTLEVSTSTLVVFITMD